MLCNSLFACVQSERVMLGDRWLPLHSVVLSLGLMLRSMIFELRRALAVAVLDGFSTELHQKKRQVFGFSEAKFESRPIWFTVWKSGRRRISSNPGAAKLPPLSLYNTNGRMRHCEASQIAEIRRYSPFWATQTTKEKQWGKFKLISDSNRNIFFQHIHIHCLGSLWPHQLPFPCGVPVPLAFLVHTVLSSVRGGSWTRTLRRTSVLVSHYVGRGHCEKKSIRLPW